MNKLRTIALFVLLASVTILEWELYSMTRINKMLLETTTEIVSTMEHQQAVIHRQQSVIAHQSATIAAQQDALHGRH